MPSVANQQLRPVHIMLKCQIAQQLILRPLVFVNKAAVKHPILTIHHEAARTRTCTASKHSSQQVLL